MTDIVFPPEPPPPEDHRCVTVSWICGLAIGSPKWQTIDAYEADECPGEGDAVVTLLDWLEESAAVQCTECHRELHQSDLHLEARDHQPAYLVGVDLQPHKVDPQALK